ncbi:MAG TPA: DJ-1/PfpI family protein [Bacteroidaceae bacterium]|nr:DJ-1/PfpI family protein [Bacteroidaceae bacterium]
MKHIAVFLADGFEEIEAIAPIDIARRAGIQVTTVSIMDDTIAVGVHQIPVVADVHINDFDATEVDMLVLPGGMPGAQHLSDCVPLQKLILNFAVNENKHLAAICAAPMAFGRLGVLSGVSATCYPGFEKYLLKARYTAEDITIDGNFVTGKGPGLAIPFGLAIVSRLVGEEIASRISEEMQINLS